jgi:hypothetical protein
MTTTRQSLRSYGGNRRASPAQPVEPSKQASTACLGSSTRP